ncbi:MAG: sensor histidine kinase [Thermoleophilaceae bacterium]
MADRPPLTRLLGSRWADPALAAALITVSLVELFVSPGRPHSPLAALFVILLGAPVAVRRTHPVAAIAVATGVFLAIPDFQGKFPPDTQLIMASVLAYSCGAHASSRAGLLGVGAFLTGMQIGVGFSEFPNVELAFGTLPLWWIGREVRQRRELVRTLAERNRELAAEQDAFARLSVRRERARIARELHDIVAHHLAVIVVQAGAGRMAAPGQNGDAAARFESVRQSGGQALTEMSRLVDILQTDSEGADGGRGRLRLLLRQANAGGLDVRVTPLPREVRLPAEVEESAFRVVQEGLTNAMKHAPGAQVHVRLAVSGDAFEVEVRDWGGAVPSVLAQTGSGLGLTGMRERIESLGGRLEAGPEADGGWRLQARLPGAARPLTPAR